MVLLVMGLLDGPGLLAASRIDAGAKRLEGRWLIQVREGEDAKAAAARAGASYIGPLKGVEGFHRVQFFRPLESRASDAGWQSAMARNLEAEKSILIFEEEHMLIRHPRSFVPPDPFFAEQWHLENVGQSGGIPFSDVGVRPVWDRGLNGTGVTIGVVDTGIEYTHPDLYANWLGGSGYDYLDGDSNASPASAFDRHGTAVAGIPLASSNSVGGLGIAHKAKLVPIRLIPYSPTTGYPEGAEASALSHHNSAKINIDIYNNSWGPSDNAGVHYADTSLILKSALAANVQNGRNGLGNIYVWAAGNGGLNGDNSNYDGYNSLPYTISVGALGHDEIKQGYSEPGANLLVMAPSGGRGAGILTTDLSGAGGYSTSDVFDDFNGTSAAAPMVSGVVALMLQQRPGLNWLDVQQVLARTAVPVDFSPEKWQRNGAGLWTSHDYGFGRVDANAAVQLARDWPLLGPLQTVSAQQSRQVSLQYGVLREGAITIQTDIEVQLVRVTVHLDHSDWGDLRIELISPSGTRSVLAEPHSNTNSGGEFSWTYLSTRHLGESSSGSWRLEVTLQGPGNPSSVWTDWSLQVLGHDLSGRSNRIPAGGDLTMESTVYPVEFDTLTGLSDPDGDPLELISVQYPRAGTLEPLGSGRFRFSMGETRDGTETFSVLYGDGKGGVVRRLVRVLDPRPVARNDLFPVQAARSADLPVLNNDLDPDGDSLRLVSLSGSFVGEATIIDESRIRYTAPAGYSGVARINYHLTDDSDGESNGWVTVVSEEASKVALQFDGEDDHLLMAPTTAVGMNDTFTAEAWIYPESYGEFVTGFGRIYDRDSFVLFLNGFDHAFYNDRSLVAYVLLANGATVAINSGPNVINLNTWQHVAISYDSSNSFQPVRMYINGVSIPVSYPPEVSSGPPLLPILNNSGNPLYIGESDSGARAFKGRMREFRIWDRVLGLSTIHAQQHKRLTGMEAGLKLYLPLDLTLEPHAVSAGAFSGTVAINGAVRIPSELPWKELDTRYTLLEDTGSGWWQERTLGWIFGDYYPWIYLPSLKWAYSGHGPGKNTYLLYPAGSSWGWIQSTPALYPWIYRFSTASWLWYFEGTENPAWYFDYSISDWVSVPDRIPGS